MVEGQITSWNTGIGYLIKLQNGLRLHAMIKIGRIIVSLLRYVFSVPMLFPSPVIAGVQWLLIFQISNFILVIMIQGNRS
jgi:hypothetical protein